MAVYFHGENLRQRGRGRKNSFRVAIRAAPGLSQTGAGWESGAIKPVIAISQMFRQRRAGGGNSVGETPALPVKLDSFSIFCTKNIFFSLH
jgi:hypothetical protein